MSADKTEQPTDKRLREAREKGDVAKSREIPSTAIVLVVFVYIWAGFDWIAGEMQELMILAVDAAVQPFAEGLKTMAAASMRVFCLLVLPLAALAALAGTFGHLCQTGVMFAFKAVTPKLENLNPKQWFSKTFSIRNLVEFIRSLIKIGVVSMVFYKVFMGALPVLLRVPGHGPDAASLAMRQVMRETASYCLAAFAGLAALDWLFQKHQFLKKHRMSKDEVKREFKEAEGDPQIRGQRKQLHQEILMNDKMRNIKNADVLVTNPTHLAIAIEYKEGKTPLPVILAKGEGLVAQRMIREAEAAGIPIMRNVPLAHDLFEQGNELQYIPSGLVEPVAEVLKWLREMRAGEEAL